MAQWVGNLALSLLWLLIHLWHGFDPWPGSFCMPWVCTIPTTTTPTTKKRSKVQVEEHKGEFRVSCKQ